MRHARASVGRALVDGDRLGLGGEATDRRSEASAICLAAAGVPAAYRPTASNPFECIFWMQAPCRGEPRQGDALELQ